jgi:ribA/ribD-fused uncharacterized protein
MASSEDYVFFWKPEAENGYLCQWYKSPFEMDGNQFVTAEQCMMYKKAELFKDSEIMEQIISTPGKTPNEHKQMGRLVKNFDGAVWDERALDIVTDVSYHKFGQNADLKEKLVSTSGKHLVEASPHDSIWGIGFKEDDAMSNKKSWGKNKLGKALMAAREKIINSG